MAGQAPPSGPENGPEVGPQLCVLRRDLHDPLPRLHPPPPVLHGGQHHEELRFHVRGHLGHNTPLFSTTTTKLILPFLLFDITYFFIDIFNADCKFLLKACPMAMFLYEYSIYFSSK